jgi:hypothetical protein
MLELDHHLVLPNVFHRLALPGQQTAEDPLGSDM